MKNLKHLIPFLIFLLLPSTMMAQEDITDQYLQNADLSTLGGGWSFGDNGYNYTDWNTSADVPVVEFYHTWGAYPGTSIGSTKNFHFTQTITLPAGDYRIAVSAFYREGNGNGTNTKAYIFAGDKQQYVYGLTSGEQADVNGTTGKYVGSSDLLRAANAFSKGDFSNAFDFSLPTEQEITLGFRGYIDTYCSWCILGPVKLYKYSLEDYLVDYRAKVAEANALSGKMGAAEAQALNDALVPESSFSLCSEVTEAIATLTNAINAARVSIENYATLTDVLDKASVILQNVAGVVDNDAITTYYNAVSDVQRAYDAGTVTDFAGSVTTVEAALVPLVRYQTADNSDYTLAIVNPHINGSGGWTCERPYGGNGPMLSGDKFEYWAGNAWGREDGSFDYHQEITGLPDGYYKVTASMYNSLNDEGGSYTVFSPTSGVYAASGNQEVVALVDEDGMALIPYTTDEILVTNGTIRIGVKNVVTPMAARWFVADDFHLTLVRTVNVDDLKPYAVLSNDNTVLTFYYDDQKESRNGMDVGLFENWYSSGWIEENSNITTVVFDDSFANCTSLTSTAYWFIDCNNLTTITGIENLKTDNVTNMSGMFSLCRNLGILDVSGFKTDNVTDMSDMFDSCQSLGNLDLSGFNTEKVTNMNGMFSACSNLTSLDLSGFKTYKVTSASSMFVGCTSLTTIYAGDGWSMESLTDGRQMFYDCPSLVGGKGTVYDENHSDAEYARIDGGDAAPGYFTAKGANTGSIPTDGLVAYYPFNGNANDESGHGNNGTPMENVTLTTGVHDEANGAYQFGGTDNPGSIHIPNSESLIINDGWSFATYIKPTSYDGMNGWGEPDRYGGHAIMGKSHDQHGFSIQYSITEETLRTKIGHWGDEWEADATVSGNYLNHWTHIAYTYTNSVFCVYINGELVCRSEKTPDFSVANTQDYYLGKYDDFWYPMNGVMDEVCIYNRALTADEVRQMAQFAEGSTNFGEKQTFTVNGVSFNMVKVNGGTFMMGSEDGSEDEKPVHQVTLTNDYYIGETEVTQELWEAVMGSNHCNFTDSPLLPVEASWNESQTFIERLNELTGLTFRLPTEAEWEFAARGGNASRGYLYSGSNNLDEVGWYNENSDSKTHVVASKAPNELGLYDMSGNVWEWCQDWFGSFSSEPQVDPTGPSSAAYRVKHGGAWSSDGIYCSVSVRHALWEGNRGIDNGLRLAISSSTEAPVPTDGLVAYYPFNGNANDESGHGYHATPCNNYQFEDGIVGGCITVEGQGYMESSGGHVLLPQLDFDASSGVTLSLWVKAMNTIDSEAEVYIGFGDHTAHDQLYIYQDPNSSLVSFEYHESRIEVPYLENYTGKWVMYTLTCGADGKLKAYVNGAIAGEEDVDYDGQINTSYAALGRHWWYYGDATSTRFIGSFDEVCIYNRALTADEVRQMAQYAEKEGGAIPDEPIDLGLPSGTKWAPWNVGASKPEDLGGHYAWGETEEKDYYDWNTYVHCIYGDEAGDVCHFIGSNIAGTQYDVATEKWGGQWMMPTKEQYEELLNNCTSEWTTFNGIWGSKFTGPNGNSIFLPAAGWNGGGNIIEDQSVNSTCDYWTATFDSDNEWDAYLFDFTNSYVFIRSSSRYVGLSVRPVISEAGNTNAEPYAVLSDDNTTLTFYYDTKKAERGGLSAGPFNYNSTRWDGHAANITTIIFDDSFANCTTLTSTARWFYECSNLSSIVGIENLKTENVTDMNQMFRGCSSLTSLDVSNFNTSNVKDMEAMFYGCSGLISLDVSNFNTSNVIDMDSMFDGCHSLTSLDVSNFNTANVTSMFCMFYGCSSLTSLDVSSFNTENVLYMSGIFYGCSGLTSIDLSSFNTENVTNMSGMFQSCSGLTSLDLSSFNTKNVTDMSYMFRDCSSLTSLDLSSFNTANVTDMSNMFCDCSGLTSLDVSNFNTANVTNMKWMFLACSGLTSLDVSSFNTEKVTDMIYMFQGCSNLTSLDLSSFNTKNVTDMGGMFIQCSALKTIYGSNWDTSSVTYGEEMFGGCENLVGGKGTVYDDNHIDHTYARIDGGEAAPGYFTAKETNTDTDISSLDNVIYVERTEASAGSDLMLSVKMKNSAAIRGFQFDMYLPEGVTVAKNNKGRFIASLSTGRLDDGDEHTLTVTQQSDGSYRFLCGSLYEETFLGNDGEIATVKLNIAEDMADGDYPMYLRKIKLTENDISKKYETAEVKSTLTISSYTIGDINDDREVDVSDYIGIANHIMGNTPAGFNAKAADVDGDGLIDVSDYIGVANIILTGSIYGNQQQSRISRHGYIE